MPIDHVAANAHATCNLVRMQVVEPPEDQTFPAARGQFGDRLRKQNEFLTGDTLAFGIRPLIENIEVVVDRTEVTLANVLMPAMIDEKVSENAVEEGPGIDRPRVRADKTQTGLLHEIVRRRGIAQLPARVSTQLRVMKLDDLRGLEKSNFGHRPTSVVCAIGQRPFLGDRKKHRNINSLNVF